MSTTSRYLRQASPSNPFQLAFFFLLLSLALFCLLALNFFVVAYAYDICHAMRYATPLPPGHWALLWDGNIIFDMICLLLLGAALLPLAWFYKEQDTWYGHLGYATALSCLICSLLAGCFVIYCVLCLGSSTPYRPVRMRRY